METVAEKWKDRYFNAMKSRSVNWDGIRPIPKFSSTVRMVTYTTNAIESLTAPTEVKCAKKRVSK